MFPSSDQSRSRALGRKLAVVGVGLVAAASLAACSGGSAAPNGGQSGSAAPAAPVTLNYTIWDEAQKPTMQKIADNFHQQNPNVTVDISVVPLADYWSKLQTTIAAGSGPDVFWMNGPHIKLYAANNAIALTDRYGRDYFGYGGDCGDAPNDLDFSGNGILFADRTPKPFLAQVKYLYQGFRTVIEPHQITIENRLLFTNSADFECVVRVAAEGRTVAEAILETDVPPGQTRCYPSPVVLPNLPGEYATEVSYRLRQAVSWAQAGHEVGWEQAVFTVGNPVRPRVRSAAPQVVNGIHNVGVRGEHFQALFSRLQGGLVSYRYGLTSDGGRELLRAAPQPNFWHAPTSNERGWGMPFRDGLRQLASRYAGFDPAAQNPVVTADGDRVAVSYRYLLPTTPQTDCTVTYLVDGSGRIEVTLAANVAESLPDLPEFGMQFVTDASLRNLVWYGEGPDEAYVDRRSGARLGVYRGQVADQLARYLRPQESGSHPAVRWASVTDDRGAGLRFDAELPMEFSALAWTPSEIENARHHVDLPPIQHTVLRPALMRRGVGGDDTWGATTHPEYLLPKGELVFRFGFQGLR